VDHTDPRGASVGVRALQFLLDPRLVTEENQLQVPFVAEGLNGPAHDRPGRMVASHRIHGDSNGHQVSAPPTGRISFLLTYPQAPHALWGNLALPHFGHGLSVTGRKA
jgi:hypothetical protein